MSRPKLNSLPDSPLHDGGVREADFPNWRPQEGLLVPEGTNRPEPVWYQPQRCCAEKECPAICLACERRFCRECVPLTQFSPAGYAVCPECGAEQVWADVNAPHAVQRRTSLGAGGG